MKLLKLLPIFILLVFISTSCTEDDLCPAGKCKDNEVCKPDTGKCIPKQKNKCKDVKCDDGKTCDPADGVCKGGTANKCENVKCDEGQTCDPADGKCKADSEDKCKNVKCDDGKTCDPADGKCKGGSQPTDIKTIVELRKYGIDISDKTKKIDGVDLTTMLEGVVVGVKGNKSIEKYGIYLQQEGAVDFAGVYVDLFHVKAEATLPEFKLGDKVKVKGKHLEFFGRTQISPAVLEDIEKVGTGTITPMEATGADCIEKYESMLFQMKNAPFVVTEVDGHHNATVKDSNDVTFLMNSGLHFPYYKAPQGTKLTKVVGIMSYEHDFKVFPRGSEDLEIEVALCGGVECTDAQYCKDDVCVDNVSKENTDALCKDGIDNDGDNHIDCDDFDCNGTPACDKCKNSNCQNGQECDPTDGECKDPQTAITISEVRAGDNNKFFTTEGIVTAVIAKGYHIQDGTSGIYIYTGTSTPTVNPAEKVVVKGKKIEYNGLIELVDTVVRSQVADTMPNFKQVDAANVADFEAEESMLVEFANGPFTVVEAASEANHGNIKMKDSNNKEFTVRTSYYEFVANANDTFTTLRGVIKQFNTTYTLYPRTAEDIGKVSVTCNPECKTWEICSATDTCTLKSGKCNIDGDCNTANGEVCNMTNHSCEVPAPVCNPVCDDWKECTATDTCTLKAGRCDLVGDCTNGATDCTDHLCVGGADPQFPNADFTTWTDDATPTDWVRGNISTTTTFTKSVRDGNFALDIVGTESKNKYIINTAFTTMTDNKPKSITFDMMGTGKISLNVSCDLDGNGKTTGEQKTYTLDGTTFNKTANNGYVEFTAADWTTYTITTGDELNDFWKAGVDCRVEFKIGKNVPFNGRLDNIIINY